MCLNCRPDRAEGGGGEVEEFGFAAFDVQAERLVFGAGEEAGGQRDAAGVAEDFQGGAVGEDAEFEFAAFEFEGRGMAQAGEGLLCHIVDDRFTAYGQADLPGSTRFELRLNIPQIAFEVAQGIVAGRDGLVVPGVGGCVQFGDLGDGFAEEAQAVRGLAKGQGAGDAHLLVEGHLRVAAAVHPGDLDTASVLLRDVAVALYRVVVAAEIDLAQIGFGREFVAVEGADQIVTVGGGPDPLLDTRFAAHRQREEVRALARAGDVHLLNLGPVLQVGRGVEGELSAVQIERHDPALRRGEPDHFRVPVLARHML